MSKKGLLKFTAQPLSSHKTRPEPGFISFLGNLDTRGKLLDIGCGIGLEASYAQELGFEVTGIDKDYSCIKKAKEINSKVNFKQINFFNYIKNVQKNEFSVVVDSKFSNKLTFGQLKRYYKKVSKILIYEGYMYLQILSTDDAYCKEHCPKRKWTKIDDLYVRYFSKKELQKLLMLTGLKIESFKTVKQKYHETDNVKEETYHIVIARQIVKKW